MPVSRQLPLKLAQKQTHTPLSLHIFLSMLRALYVRDATVICIALFSNTVLDRLRSFVHGENTNAASTFLACNSYPCMTTFNIKYFAFANARRDRDRN